MDARVFLRAWLLAGAVFLLAGCGGSDGGDGGTPPPAGGPGAGGGGPGGGNPGGGGGGGGTPADDGAPRYPARPASDAEAARFLTQATFGVTRADIARVKAIGYSAWIDEQIAMSPSLVLPHLESVVARGFERNQVSPQMRRNYWLWQAANANDQLRQRMGFALSEILVVSDREVADGNLTSYRIADYQDTLTRGAFGSYRSLLEQVSLHPAMGYFLSHVGNRKADPARNVAPDENYGREVMQLFSIGLVKLNPDGTPVLDAEGNTIPTYDEQVVSAMARVFTGWTYAGQTDARFGRNDNTSYAPMECHPAFHDDKPKTIFDAVVVDEGSDCRASLARTLDALARHPNVAPFISRQLIQRFVTSNPSPAYVRRVAKVWTDSNGNLGQVVKAILLDNEARIPPADGDLAFGKAREPLIKVATLWRTFGARYVPAPENGRVSFRFSNAGDLTTPIAQDSLRAPSVFNFFEPGYRLPGANGSEGILAPEFQILTEANFLTAHNLFDNLIWNLANEGQEVTENTTMPIVNLGPLVALLAERKYDDAIEEINLLLFYGSFGAESKAILKTMCTELAGINTQPRMIARSLVLASLSSPEFAIQR